MNLIEEIKNRLPITDLLYHLGIDMNGGFCHSIYKTERTPSMKIYKDSNSYYCFATNQGGDVVQLYKDIYNLDTKDALKDLAKIAGIDFNGYVPDRDRVAAATIRKDDKLPIESMSDYEKEVYYERLGFGMAESEALLEVKRERLKKNIEIFEEMYRYCFNKYGFGSAHHYLTYTRALPEAVLKRFRLFVVDNYFEVNNHLKKMFNIQDLQRSGLYNRKEDGSGNLIFYKHRIIIPYLHNGQIVYVRGRYFDEHGSTSGDMSKYIGLSNDKLDVNTSKRFFNSDVLKRMCKCERLFIVEGEFDAIAIETMQRNCIAVPGAGNIPNKLKFERLMDYQIYLCMDADEAGSRLQENLIKIFGGFRKSVTVKKMPVKDANEFLVKQN